MYLQTAGRSLDVPFNEMNCTGPPNEYPSSPSTPVQATVNPCTLIGSADWQYSIGTLPLDSSAACHLAVWFEIPSPKPTPHVLLVSFKNACPGTVIHPSDFLERSGTVDTDDTAEDSDAQRDAPHLHASLNSGNAANTLFPLVRMLCKRCLPENNEEFFFSGFLCTPVFLTPVPLLLLLLLLIVSEQKHPPRI